MARISPLNANVYDTTIADLLREMGEVARAEKLIEEQRQAVLKRYGAHHPIYGSVLLGASRIYAAAGKIAEAEHALTEALDLAEKELSLVLRAGTESDHAVYFARNGYQLDTAINFQVNYAPHSPSAARLGMTTLLRRKGRVLDAAAAALATIRAKLSPEDKTLLDELASTRAELAKLTVAGPAATGQGDGDYAKAIAALEDKLQKIELRHQRQERELPAGQPADRACGRTENDPQGRAPGRSGELPAHRSEGLLRAEPGVGSPALRGLRRRRARRSDLRRAGRRGGDRSGGGSLSQGRLQPGR